ncbi:MAG: acyl-CoA thioesterase [Oligoflexales bacterium]|nr:acyl-CoA thioesterase [Oligoflexales bacterium]
MIFSSTFEIEIPFHDIDIMYVAWHGHYLKYFELGRTGIMREIGLDWPVVKDLGYAMPVTKVDIKYKKPLNYGVKYCVCVGIDEYEYPELKTYYSILNPENEVVHAEGMVSQIYFSIETGSSCYSIPEVIRDIFRQAEKVIRQP